MTFSFFSTLRRPAVSAGLAALLAIQGGASLPYNPELLEQLKEKSAAARRDAALQIAKMGADAKGATAELIKLLVDPDGAVRAAVAFALGEIGSGAVEAVPTLGRNASSDKDANARKEAATALGKMGAKAIKALPFLVGSFRRETDSYVRSAIAGALVRVAPASRETLTMLAEAAGDPSLEIRQLAIATLGDIGPAAKPVLSTVERAAKDNNASIAELAKTAQLRINGDLEDPPPSESLAGSDLPEWRAFSVDDLWRFLKSATPSTREKACYQLAKRKKEIGSSARNVIFELSARLKDDDEAPVRAAAAFAIGELGEPVPELARGLTDESMVVRLASSQALARLGRRARAFVRPLAQARVRDATSPVRRASGDALRRIEKDALEYLQSADSKERKNAEGLVQSVAQDSVRAFIDNLQKTDEDVRVRATLALGELGPVAREAVPQVIQLLKDEVPFVRIAAASTLANVGDDARKAKEELEKLIHDKDLRVRRQAREALARLDPRHPAVAQPKPAPPEPPKPPPAEPTATAPAPQEPQAAPKPPAASGSMASKIAGILDGEGGITEPSGESTGPETAVLNLALAHDRFDAEMAHGDAVRLSLKFFMNIQELQTMRVNYIAHNGKLLRIYKVTRAKASPFFEKLDDPFERRRARDWWSDMAERTTN